MTSIPDHSGKLVFQRGDDATLKHEPVRKSPEDGKRGGRTGKAGRLGEVTDRASRRPRRQTRNDKVQRPMPDNDYSPEDMDHERLH